MKSSGSSKTAWVPSLQAALKPRHAAVAVQLQAVLAERWARDVAAQALEVLSVAAIDDDLCVDVHPADLGERFVRRGDEAHGAHGADELGRLLSRRRAQELHVPCGGGVAGGEPRLLVDERVGRFVGAVEGATVTLEDPKERGLGPRRDPTCARRASGAVSCWGRPHAPSLAPWSGAAAFAPTSEARMRPKTVRHCAACSSSVCFFTTSGSSEQMARSFLLLGLWRPLAKIILLTPRKDDLRWMWNAIRRWRRSSSPSTRRSPTFSTSEHVGCGRENEEG